MQLPLLILHGWGSCAKNWLKMKELLEKEGVKVFIPDLPGFGKNPPLEKPLAVDDYINWIERYCQKNNLSQFFLLGHSFGGILAIKFSLKFPEKIKKLFLVSPAIIRKKRLIKELIKKIGPFFSFLPFPIKKIIYQKILKSDYPLNPGPLRETYLKIMSEDIFSYLSKLKISPIIIWGKDDKITPLSSAYLIQKEIPNSILNIIPKVGHGINLENPEKLTQVILNFLKN